MDGQWDCDALDELTTKLLRANIDRKVRANWSGQQVDQLTISSLFFRGLECGKTMRMKVSLSALILAGSSFHECDFLML